MLLLVLVLGLGHLLVSVEAAVREGTRSAMWHLGMALAIGLVLGVMAMTRYSTALLALPVAAYLAIFGGGQRVKLAVVPVVVMLLLVAPWLYRNYEVSGRLFGLTSLSLHQGTPAFQGNRLVRSMPENLELQLNKVEPSDLGKKLAVNGREAVEEMEVEFAKPACSGTGMRR